MAPGRKLALARRYHAPALTQQGLAEILGVERSTVAKWETRLDVPEQALRRAAERLGIKLTWFYDNVDSFPDFETQAPAPRTPNRSFDPLIPSDQTMLPVWRGALGEDGECKFWPSDRGEFRGVPSFLAPGDPEEHILLIASGLAMTPRLDHAGKAIVRLDAHPPAGSIVVASRPDGSLFIKVLRKQASLRLELHGLATENAPITDLRNWSLRGYVVAILHAYSGHGPNIEFDEGRPLRA